MHKLNGGGFRTENQEIGNRKEEMHREIQRVFFSGDKRFGSRPVRPGAAELTVRHSALFVLIIHDAADKTQ